MNQYQKYIQQFPSLSVAVIGDLMIDRYIFGQATRISPEAPVPVVLVQQEKAVPGGAANVARNILSLQGEARVFGTIGTDQSGTELKRLLDSAGARTEGVVLRNEPTTEKTRLLANHQQIARIDKEDTHILSEDAQNELLQKLRDALERKEIQAVILEDYAKGCFSRSFIEKILELTRRAGVIATLDPHPSNNFKVPGLHLMTPNRKEAFALAGLPYRPGINDPIHDRPLLEAGAAIMADWQPDHLLITLGGEGMALFSAGRTEPLHIPTRAQQVFDVSGAGDTVMATMTLALLAQASPYDAAAIANYAAGIVVGRIGTAAIEYSTLLQAVEA